MTAMLLNDAPHALLVLLVLCQCWMRRREIMSRGVPSAAVRFLAGLCWYGRPTEDPKDDTARWICQRKDEVRVKQMLAGADAVLLVTTVSGITIMSLEAVGIRLAPSGLMLNILAAHVCSFVARYFVRPTSKNMYIMYSLLSLVPAVRAATATDPKCLLVLNGLRLGVRVLWGLAIMDYRAVFRCNVPIAMFNILRVAEAMEEIYQDPSTRPFSATYLTALSSETFILFVIVLLVFAFESYMEGQLDATRQAVDSKISLHAVRRLLSVLFDADFQLGPDLRIVDLSPSALHLLAPGTASKEHHFEGHVFEEFIVPADHARLRRSLGACAVTSSVSSLHGCEIVPEGREGGTASRELSNSERGLGRQEEQGSARTSEAGHPGLIHLTMQNVVGDACPVELFHIGFQDMAGQVMQLVGIRHVMPREETQQGLSATQQGLSAPKPACVEHPQSTQLPPGAQHTDTAEVQNCIAHEKSSVRSDGSVSGSASSAASAHPPVAFRRRIRALKEVWVEFNPTQADWPVQKVTIVFAAPAAERQSRSMPPELRSWIVEQTWSSFHTWAQEQMNCSMHGLETSACSAPVSMHWPAGGSSDVILQAEKASIALVSGAESSDEDQDASCECLLRLSKFSKISYKAPRHHRRQAKESDWMLPQLSAIYEGR